MKKKHKKGQKLRARSRYPWESRNRIASESVSPGFRANAVGAGSSTAVRAVLDKFIRRGPGYLKENFVRIMRESYLLLEEPEFVDLAFERAKAVDISLRLYKKYDAKIRQVMQQKDEKQDLLIDKIRAEAIEELATPDFRKDVFRRLDRAINRLQQSSAADRFELALILRALLEMKEIPWGLCGLLTGLYGATMKKAEELADAEIEIFGDVLKAFEEGKDIDRLMDALKDPQRITELEQRLKGRPELTEYLQREAEKTIGEFEHELLAGEVELALFTEPELVRACMHLEKHTAAHETNAVADSRETAHRFMEEIQRCIREIASPERVDEMKLLLGRTIKAWLASKNPHAAALQLELHYLETEEPSTNSFVLSSFIGQLKRIQKRMEVRSTAEFDECRPR